MSKLAKLNQFKRYLQNNAGSIAPIFAAAAVPFFLVAGAAIDMTRVSREQVTFFNSVDGAALAIAADDRAAVTGLSATQKSARIEELKAYALTYLNATYSKDKFRDNQTNITVDLDIDGTGVQLEAHVEFPTTFMSLAGVPTIKLSADSEVKFGIRPIELVMVLDTTGSMEKISDGTKTRIQAVREAGVQLLDTLYDGTVATKTSHQDLRVGLVPFSGAVRLDTAGFDYDPSWIDMGGASGVSKVNFDYPAAAPAVWNNFYAWSQMKVNASTNLTWNGCVEARTNSTGTSTYHVDDTPPSATDPPTLFPAYLNPDTYGGITTTTSSSGAATSSAGYSYIVAGSNTATTGNECAGLTSTDCSGTNSTTNDGKLKKQENYRKYTGAIVGSPTGETTPITTNVQYSQYVGPWGGCAINKIVSLTHNRAKVQTGIQNLRAHGVTVIPEGLAWGWRTLSDTAPFTQVEGFGAIANTVIAPYDSPRWKKVMVLMTDGDNNVNEGSYAPNNSGYSSYGLLREANTGTVKYNRFRTTSSSNVETNLNTALSDTCTAIKNKGITLYVTSFGNDVSAATKTMLGNCSSGAATYYKHNTTSSELKNFFLHIGNDVLNKSIYVSK